MLVEKVNSIPGPLLLLREGGEVEEFLIVTLNPYLQMQKATVQKELILLFPSYD